MSFNDKLFIAYYFNKGLKVTEGQNLFLIFLIDAETLNNYRSSY